MPTDRSSAKNASATLRSRLQEVLDALRADYPRSAEDSLSTIIESLPDETRADDPEPVRPDRNRLLHPFGTLNPRAQEREWAEYGRALAAWRERQPVKTSRDAALDYLAEQGQKLGMDVPECPKCGVEHYPDCNAGPRGAKL